jgi:hypothetical protein
MRERRDKKVAMKACLAKIAGMETSPKRRRASSSKKSSAGQARVISVGRTDTLPRKSQASAGRRKPIVEPALDGPTEPLVTTRPKATRAAGRRPSKPKKVEPETALEAPAIEAVAAAETELVVEASAILEEATIVEVPFAAPVEAVSAPSPAPAPVQGKRALVTVVSRLLSALVRWTGVR